MKRPLGLLLLAACAPDLERLARVPPPRPVPEGLRRIEQHDPATGVLLAAWSVRYEEGGRALKEGQEQRFFASGGLRSLRFWQGGEPVGLWRSFHENGSLEQEHEHCGELVPMRFYHENGALAAEGPARNGVKEGHWRFFDEGGGLAREGGFERGARCGVWTLYHPGGALKERGRFEEDHRVGEWRRYPLDPPVWKDAFWPAEP